METSNVKVSPPPMAVPANNGQRSSATGETLPPRAAPEGKAMPEGRGSEPVPVASMAERYASGEKLEEQVDNAVDRINDFVQIVQRDLQFAVDDATGKTIVKVFDSQTEELIRQLPPDELLAIAEHLAEVRGLLLKEQA
ncbi:flagellar protein FlaG [Ectothiorhodospira haloalkaliphila]|nr:flagellar protein FlaG [Ectothiorhodospira haloalkaliphila]